MPPAVFPVTRLWREANDTTKRHGIPWEMVAPHRAQAECNHQQTLERLAERGGLSPVELVTVLRDERWHPMDPEVAEALLEKLVAAYERTARGSPGDRLVSPDERSDLVRKLHLMADGVLALQPIALREAAADLEHLVEALQHMRWCRSCSEGAWSDCGDGRKAEALITSSTPAENRP